MAAIEVFGGHYLSDELCVEGVRLADIAAEFGTPTFVYSRAALTMAYRQLDAAVGAAREARAYTICYAVKANSNLAVLNTLARLGAGFDIVSGGELERVLRAGGKASKVVFSGLGKTASEMTYALKAGIKCFNVESESELTRLAEIATSMKLRAPVSLRVNPDVDAKTHPYISTGLKNNKFGIAFERARAVYQRAATMPGIKVVGVDCHIGSQLTDAAPLVEAMGKLVALADQLTADGMDIHHICPGGGVGITYDAEVQIDLPGYASALESALGSRNVELLLEPGRAIAGNAGLLLSRVEYVKLGEHKNFLIVDAAMNDLIRPALYQAHHEIVPVRLSSGQGQKEFDVVGPVCESADVLGYGRRLNACAGDLIAVLSAGAYGFVMSSNYNTRPRAAEVMVDGQNAYLVRERETIDMLLSGEHLLPEIEV
ncbi:MAG: diaminopimelate decarboxylase [Aeromicrobium sp.]|nr:diaminopimelate decarboxylase [Burkholderiales bacterium]